MTESKSILASKTLWIVISLRVIAVVVLIVAGMHLSNPYLHKKVVEMLNEKFHADVDSRNSTFTCFQERASRVLDLPSGTTAAPMCRL